MSQESVKFVKKKSNISKIVFLCANLVEFISYVENFDA